MKSIRMAASGMLFRDNTVGTDGAGAAAAPASPPVPVTIPEGMRGEVFHFRREKVTDAAGNEVGEVKRHPSVTIPLPIVTKDEVALIFAAPSEGDGNRAAEQKFILEQVQDAFYIQARQQINEFRDTNKDGVVTADLIDYSKLSILALATMPAAERGNKISDDDLKAFLTDYAAIMPTALNKDAAKIKAQVNLLEKGLRTVKTDKKVLGVMDQVLAVWAQSTQNMEEHQAVYEMFTNRVQKWLKAEPANVMDSIL